MTFYLSKKVTLVRERTNGIYEPIHDDDRHNDEKNQILFTETPFVASESESSEDDVEQIVKANLIAKSLLSPAPDQRLGEWERYTKVSIFVKHTVFPLLKFYSHFIL